LQDDIVKFVSEPASPPRLLEILEEGKGKAKSAAKSAKETTLLSSKTHWTKMTRRRFKTVPAAVKIQPPWTAQCSSHPGSSN
jgi:hypothetical protein